jgi:hypothetical protein
LVEAAAEFQVGEGLVSVLKVATNGKPRSVLLWRFSIARVAASTVTKSQKANPVKIGRR